MRIVDYDPAHESELVAMWRASWERAIDWTDTNPLDDQIAYFRAEVLPRHRVRVVLDGDRVVGFLAADGELVAQLYIHVDYQRRGLGTRLLDLAKAESRGRLRLFTLERNRGAQRFYETHGFRIARRGREPQWGFADIEYEWTAPDGGASDG